MITLNHWLTVHVLVVMSGVVIYAVSSRTLHMRRHPSAAIAWVVSLVLLPYVAFPLYLIFGIRKVNIHRPPVRVHASSRIAGRSDTLADRTQQLSAIMGLAPVSSYRDLNIHTDGSKALETLRHMIRSATHSIDICTFILARDRLGNEVVQLLGERAREGIRVRLLVDGVGAYLGGRANFKALLAEGIRVAFFVPPLRSSLRGRTNLRNHRKMVITDKEWLFCGGRNLAAEYFEGNITGTTATPPWVDLSFDMRGALALQAYQLFNHDWDFATLGRPQEHHTRSAGPAASAPAVGQLIASGPDQTDDTLYTLLISGFFNARKSILLVTPYFVPDPSLLMSLTLAARRGVRVDLVMPGKSNHRLADIARHRGLRELSSAGARIWFLKRMIHAKATVIDDEIVLAGSANLDERSLFLNYELMVAFYEPADVRRFADWIDRQRTSAAPYSARTPGFWRETAEGLLIWLAFQL